MARWDAMQESIRRQEEMVACRLQNQQKMEARRLQLKEDQMREQHIVKHKWLIMLDPSQIDSVVRDF